MVHYSTKIHWDYRYSNRRRAMVGCKISYIQRWKGERMMFSSRTKNDSEVFSRNGLALSLSSKGYLFLPRNDNDLSFSLQITSSVSERPLSPLETPFLCLHRTFLSPHTDLSLACILHRVLQNTIVVPHQRWKHPRLLIPKDMTYIHRYRSCHCMHGIRLQRHRNKRTVHYNSNHEKRGSFVFSLTVVCVGWYSSRTITTVR